MTPTIFGWRWWDSPYLLLTITALLWGANAVAGKLATGHVPPFTLTALRWTGAAILFFIICRPMLPRYRDVLHKNRLFLFLLGALGFAGFNFALYGALHFTSAINAAIEQSGMPMVILLGMVVFFGERAKTLQIAGAIIAITGVLYTATRGDLASILSLDVNIGDGIMLIAVLLYSGYSIALKKKPDLPWQVLMFALTLSAALFSIPASLVEISMGYLPTLGWQTPALVGFTVLFPSLISQTFFVRGIELIGAGRAGLFMNLVPVFGAMLAVVVIGETFHIYHAIGLGLVIGGIALAEYTARRA